MVILMNLRLGVLEHSRDQAQHTIRKVIGLYILTQLLGMKAITPSMVFGPMILPQMNGSISDIQVSSRGELQVVYTLAKHQYMIQRVIELFSLTKWSQVVLITFMESGASIYIILLECGM